MSQAGKAPSHPGKGGPFVPLYGVVIHKCIGAGDLAEMKKLVVEAEHQLAEHGDVRGALEVLKAEIAKLEHK